MRRTLPFIASLIFVAIVFNGAAAADLRVIAASGRPAPGMPGDARFSYFLQNSPTINDRGEVAFEARWNSSATAGEPAGIWTTVGNQLAPLVTDADPAPGFPNGRAFTLHFNNIAINNSGAVAFSDMIEWWYDDLPVGTESGIWSNRDGSLKLVARMGDPAPGAPAGSVLDQLPMALRANDAGDIAFLAQFDDKLDNDRDPTRHGIWTHSGGTLVPIAVTGGSAPGFAGSTFQMLDAPLLNNAGHLAFTGQVWVGAQIRRGLWSNRPGVVAPVLLEGDLLPISDTEFAPFVRATRIAFNGHDRIAISAAVDGPGDQNRGGLWLETDAGFSRVMAQGQHAPGAPAQAVFSSGTGQFSLNDAGQIAFGASHTTDRTRFEPRLGAFIPVVESGIWLYDDEQLRLIAREGDLAPSFETETRFRNFSAPMINSLGQVVFRAQLETVDDPGAFVVSLWATDLNGNLQLVANTGTPIDVDTGPGVELREIYSIEIGHKTSDDDASTFVYAGAADGRGRSFNDRGELAFHVRFLEDPSHGSTGEALLVANTLGVPEPASLAMASSLCAAMLVMQKWRRRNVGGVVSGATCKPSIGKSTGGASGTQS